MILSLSFLGACRIMFSSITDLINAYCDPKNRGKNGYFETTLVPLLGMSKKEKDEEFAGFDFSES